MNHSITNADVLAIHTYELTRGKSPADVWRAVRTKVHAKLQDALPVPSLADIQALAPMKPERSNLGGVARTGTSKGAAVMPIAMPVPDDLLHAYQKAHGAALWVEANRLVEAAGITETGRVSS